MRRLPSALTASRWGRALWILGIVTVTGCAQQVACTTIGCSSQVVVDVHSLSGRIGDKPFQATLCVAGDCQMQAGQLSGSDAMITVVKQLGVNGGPSFDPAKPVSVSLRVLTRDGTTVADAKGSVTLRPVSPNGEKCGPVCYQASMALSGTSLVEVTTP